MKLVDCDEEEKQKTYMSDLKKKGEEETKKQEEVNSNFGKPMVNIGQYKDVTCLVKKRKREEISNEDPQV